MINYFKYLLYLIVIIGFNSASAGSYDDFFKAIELDQPEVVSQLLARGFDPNSPSPKGTPALILTYQKKSFKVLDVLVEWKTTNLNVQSADGENLLMLAAINNQIALADKLISKGADVNKPGWTALHYAASKGLIDMMRLLLDQQAYLDAESPNGTTPLMMASGYGSPMAVKLLLEEGADPRIRNKLGLSALDMAKQPEKAEAKIYLQAFLLAWEQKYTKPSNQIKQSSIEQAEPEETESVQSEKQGIALNAFNEAENVQTQEPAGVMTEVPGSQASLTAAPQIANPDQLQPTEEDIQEAVTEPVQHTINIEMQAVRPVYKLPDEPVMPSKSDTTGASPVKPNTPGLSEAIKEIIRKADAHNGGAVRVKPLDTNNKNTSYTRQLQSRRVVTVDIIEVNNEDVRPGQ